MNTQPSRTRIFFTYIPVSDRLSLRSCNIFSIDCSFSKVLGSAASSSSSGATGFGTGRDSGRGVEQDAVEFDRFEGCDDPSLDLRFVGLDKVPRPWLDDLNTLPGN